MSDVNIRMSIQDAEAAAAWSRFNRDQRMAEERFKAIQNAGVNAGQRTAEEITKAQQAIRKSTEDSSKLGQTLGSVSQTLISMSGFGSGAAAFLTVTRLIRTEWDAILERQSKAAGAQIDVEGAWRLAASTLPSNMPPERLLSDYSSVRGGQLQKALMSHYGAAGSAGDIPHETIVRMNLAVRKYHPELDEASSSAMLTGAIQMQKIWGGVPEETVAQAFQLAESDPAKDYLHTGQYTIPGITLLAGGGGYKDSFRDLAAMMTGAGQVSGDVHMRRTRNNIQRLFMQLRQQLVKRGLATGGESQREILSIAQGDPAFASAFLGQAATDLGMNPDAMQEVGDIMSGRRLPSALMSTEATSYLAFSQMIDPRSKGNRYVKEEAAALKKIQEPAAAMADLVRTDKQLTESRLGGVAEVERKRQEEETRFFTGETGLGTKGAARKALMSSLDRMGATWLAKTVAGAQFDYETFSMQDEGQIKRRQLVLERKAAFDVRSFGQIGMARPESLREAEKIIEQNTRIIELLEVANAQRQGNVTADKAAMLNLVPRQPPVGKVMSDPPNR